MVNWQPPGLRFKWGILEFVGFYLLQVEKRVLDKCRTSCPERMLLCALLHYKFIYTVKFMMYVTCDDSKKNKLTSSLCAQGVPGALHQYLINSS